MSMRCRVDAAVRQLLAPAALVAIAAYQIILVQTNNLTPWKGGGFGMFSTDRTGANRTVRVYLVKSSGGEVRQLPVSIPRELEGVRMELRQAPTPARARALAQMMSALSWREPSELEALAGQGPESLLVRAMAERDGSAQDPRLQRLLHLPRAWPRGLHSTARHGAGRPVAFDQVVVEVWEQRYDAARPAMRAGRVVEAWSGIAPTCGRAESAS